MKIKTCTLLAGGEHPSSTRFLNPKYLELGPLRFVQDIVLPAMDRQGTTDYEFFNPWGWSAKPDGKPVDTIELDARRLCNANPQTRHIAELGKMVDALTLLKKSGKTTAIYIGSPYDPKWARYTLPQWAKLAEAIAKPFRGLVDRWDVDMLSESNGQDAGSTFADCLAEAAACEVGGEPRPLTGKVAARVSICVASKFASSGGPNGDRYHLPLMGLPKGAEVHIIEGSESLETARGWVRSGACYLLGTSSRRTARDFLEAAS